MTQEETSVKKQSAKVEEFKTVLSKAMDCYLLDGLDEVFRMLYDTSIFSKEQLGYISAVFNAKRYSIKSKIMIAECEIIKNKDQ